MPLGAPAIVGPVSTCSSSVRVLGQFSGSRVRIFIVGQAGSIGDATVPWSDAFVPIDQSRLFAKAQLVATQKVGNETSPRSPTGQIVDQAVNGLVTIPNKLYSCAQSIFITDCCPGARLDVVQNGTLLGSATAVSDQAWIDFNPNRRVVPGSPVDIRQIICGSSTPVITTSAMPETPPVVNRNHLDSPSIVEPIEECQRVVPLQGIIEGATAQLQRDGRTIFESPVPVPGVNVLTDALKVGEVYEVAQSMPRCELGKDRPRSSIVKPLTALARPRVDGPLCKGPHQVIISRLKPGATVRLFRGNTELGRWEAASQSMPVDVNVPGPATVTARQELCGIVSPKSRPYTVATARSGRWFIVEDDKGDDLLAHSFAIHAALVHTGHIVLFSGDQHSSAQNQARPQDINHCERLNCFSLTLEKINAPTTDVFCSGHAFLGDGRLLVAGGTEEFRQAEGVHVDHFPGLAAAWLFNPTPSAPGQFWSRAPTMSEGRWYPTLVPLPNGRILALSGHPSLTDTTRHNNNTLEIFDGNSWQQLGDSPDIQSQTSEYLYPRVFVGPTGGVFSATPIMNAQQESARLPKRSATWPGSGVAWIRSAPPVTPKWGAYDGFNAPAVLLPLVEDADDPANSYRFQVMLAGDQQPWIADLGTLSAPEPSPRWRAMGQRPLRLNSSIVLLPSVEVMLCGGVGNPGDDTTGVLEPEMLVRSGSDWEWDTAPFAPAKIVRNYHSTALLMPDGRVFTGGSNVNAEPGPESNPDGSPRRHLEIEIYEPWYVCRPRPRILSAPGSVRSGARLVVRIKSSERIARLVLMRAASATHGFSPDQRCISMIARPHESTEDFIGVVPASAVAVPGYYLLYAVTEKNVPSRGVFVRIDPPG